MDGANGDTLSTCHSGSTVASLALQAYGPSDCFEALSPDLARLFAPASLWAMRLKKEARIDYVDIMLDPTGVEPSLQTTTCVLAKGGTLVPAGMSKPFVYLPLLAMCYKEMPIKMFFCYGTEIETALKLFDLETCIRHGSHQSATEAWGISIENLIQGVHD